MIVVADTSPFIGLLKIGCVDALPRLFGSILIPDEVAAELVDPNRPPEIQSFMAARPDWLIIRAATSIEVIADLHLGECAAISLARELKADLLLIDDRAGREAAIARNVRTLRTTALLFEAATVGVLPDLRMAYEKLAATNFRVNRKTLDDLLKRFDELNTRE